MSTTSTRPIGADIPRIDGPQKVTGTATYAYEHPLTDPAYVFPLLSTVARGRVTSIDARAALALPGVLAVLTHDNAPELADTSDAEHAILQSAEVHFRGEVVGAIVAESLEIGAHAVGLVRIEQQAAEHRVVLSADDPDLLRPDGVEDAATGDVEAALRDAATSIVATYSTPMEHNNPLEPHTTVAQWQDGTLRLYESTQSVHGVRDSLAGLFGLAAEDVHVTAPFVGGGFGSKGVVHAPTVLAVMAARAVPGRPVKLALLRPQMCTLGGHRAPTIQRVRLGADAGGTLVAISHDLWQHTSRVKQFAEQATAISRMMYAAPRRRATHRMAPLDVPAQSWMRAPGTAPGSFALECAMDELAVELRLDPIELRVRNDPPIDPTPACPGPRATSSRACARAPSDSAGPAARRRRAASATDAGWSARASPERPMRPSRRRIAGTDRAPARWPLRGAHRCDGRRHGHVDRADAGGGRGARRHGRAGRAGDRRHRAAVLARAGWLGGIGSWGSTLYGAAWAFRDAHGADPQVGDEVTAGAADNPAEHAYAMYTFGAQFAEVRVDADTGEIRVPRMLGVFAGGRIVNPRTARARNSSAG